MAKQGSVGTCFMVGDRRLFAICCTVLGLRQAVLTAYGDAVVRPIRPTVK